MSARSASSGGDYRTFYHDRRVMITGGLGFIGSTLAHQLVELGARVLIVDSLIPEYGGNLFNIAGIEDRCRGGRRKLVDVVFSPLTACFAVVGLALSFFLPTDGLGVTVCWFKSCFGLPCPGCGLTRSVTCISHLEFGKAWDYHPFGALVYVLFMANVVLLVVPKTKREAVKNRISTNDRWLRRVYMALVLSFLTFGCLRILLSISSI